jgi:SM-20-related protein
MTYCDFEAFDAAPLQHDPYDYLVLPQFLRSERFKDVLADYPKVPGPGSHPPSELDIRGHFASLLEELCGSEFQRLVERKFEVDLTGRPTMYTVRGFVREKDGAIHTDSDTKLITVLLYMNEDWRQDAGRLRILRSATDLEDFAAEVSPNGGTLLIFRRSERSWHGHKSISGPRRAIQLNWVSSQAVVDHEQGRHRISTKLKKFRNLFIPSSAA